MTPHLPSRHGCPCAKGPAEETWHGMFDITFGVRMVIIFLLGGDTSCISEQVSICRCEMFLGHLGIWIWNTVSEDVKVIQITAPLLNSFYEILSMEY